MAERMNLIRHRYYRKEIISSICLTILLLALGAVITDGGILGTIFLIASISFWLGALIPLNRKEKKKSDRIYLAYGLFGLTILSIFIAPLVWNYRLNS
jgi:heme/copper-type cytochrome/quinol oxidase subunit 4